MKILIIGGAGFIGSHIVDTYQAAGHTVAIFDDFSSGKRGNISEKTQVFEGNIINIKDVERIFDQFQPEIINHHAAQVSVTASVKEPLVDAQKNIIGTLNLLEKAHSLPQFKKFIYATSGGAMYGVPSELPLRETSEVQPVSPYGLSKYVAEQYVWLYSRLYGLKATVLRYANVYGPRQDPHGEAGVCAIFSNRMLAGQPIAIYGDGLQQRDYVYVGDVANANLTALQNGEGGSYNISTQNPTCTKDVYLAFKQATNYTLPVEYKPERTGEIRISLLSNEKARVELGWVPTTSFEEGVAKTVTWATSQILS